MRLGSVTDRERWVRPFLVGGLPVFVWNSAAMDFPHEPPADVRYLGPMVPARATPVARRTDGRTGVYVSTGSYWSGGAGLLGNVVAAAGRRPDWDVVVGLGGRYERARFGDVPDNVELLDWAPQREMLEWADVAVLHGGITSIVEATLAGTPMVCFSTGTNDQEGHVARVVHHGLGRAGDRRSDDASAIADHVDAVLAPGPRRRVDEMRRALLDDVESGRAVDAIEALAAG
jgi:UDP:flavonoid glycosyltransferase YjiC (YdhE family)